MERTKRFEESLSAYNLRDPESKRRYNRKLFSVVATRYDVITRVLSFRQDRRWKKELLQQVAPTEPRTVVDVASGTGDFAIAAAHRFSNAQIIAMDLTPEMLTRGRRNARRRRVPLGRIRFELGDMDDLPYQEGSIDLVTAGYALRNAPSLDSALREIYRVLRPGGSLGILDFSHSRAPVLSLLQIGMLRFWGRLWGRLLHGNPEVYGYIAESLRRFPDHREFLKLLRRKGFEKIRTKRYFLGLVAIITARK